MNKPHHIAFIMDGNNRWSVAHQLHFSEGHRKGVQVVEDILDFCFTEGIHTVTLYAFSSENWKRSEEEKNLLFDLLYDYFQNQLQKVITQGTRIKVIGDTKKFPDRIKEAIRLSEERSANQNKNLLQVGLGYGGRDEIVRATKCIADAVKKGEINISELDEDKFGEYLDTSGAHDPDILVRTSGEYRISNFLLYQTAYTEFFFTPTLWPDFNREELKRIIKEFSHRERRYGGRLQC